MCNLIPLQPSLKVPASRHVPDGLSSLSVQIQASCTVMDFPTENFKSFLLDLPLKLFFSQTTSAEIQRVSRKIGVILSRRVNRSNISGVAALSVHSPEDE